MHVQERCTNLPAHPLVSPPTISYSYAQTIPSFPYPEFQACDTHTHIYVARMNINAVGMSMNPFEWNFYVLMGKYLHYSIFDDVITLHH